MSELAGGETSDDGTAGQTLRQAREAQGLSLQEVASSTRIPMRHLQTIERGDYDGLPAPTYSAGFVKTWARFLALDGQALSERFRAEMGMARDGSDARPLPYEPADPRRVPPPGLALLAILVAVVLGLGYLYWRGSSEQPTVLAAASSDHPSPAPVQAGPAVAPTPAVTSPAAAGQAVTIGASQDVWIKVSDSGKTLFMNVLHPGDHFQVPADATAPLLTTGRPGVTTISVGQTPIPPVGDPDRAAKDVSLKAADLLARVGTPAPAQPPAGAATPVENTAG